MPKIIFRPNPTPPPFVPPVPPVPTGPYVTMSPFPFNSDTPVTCKICNVEVSDTARSFELSIYSDDYEVINKSENIESPIVGDFNVQAVSIESSSNDLQAMITFYDFEAELESVELFVYQP